MNLPFQVRKTYTTTYTSSEVTEIVKRTLSEKDKVLLVSARRYVGSIVGESFSFYRNFNSRKGPANPRISAKITATNPTTVDVEISPHYSRILFFFVCAILLVPVALFVERLSINGVLKVPGLAERILLGLFVGSMLAIWCYFDSIRPIRQSELWLKEELKLVEIKQGM